MLLEVYLGCYHQNGYLQEAIKYQHNKCLIVNIIDLTTAVQLYIIRAGGAIMREMLAYIMVLGMAGVYLWIFCQIAISGSITAGEDSPVILSLELGLFSVLIVFALYGIIQLWRGK